MRSSGSRFHCSSRPGRKFSMRMSLSDASRRTKAWSSGSWRSAVTESLPRDWTRCHSESDPSQVIPHLRSGSPRSGCSILMTSAPKSANTRPARGPAISVPSSRTRRSASGPRPSAGPPAPPAPGRSGFLDMVPAYGPRGGRSRIAGFGHPPELNEIKKLVWSRPWRSSPAEIADGGRPAADTLRVTEAPRPRGASGYPAGSASKPDSASAIPGSARRTRGGRSGGTSMLVMTTMPTTTR